MTKNQETLEELVAKLREANENLVIASVGATEMQAQAEAVNDRQSEFLSMLAHELRNPLAPIGMAAELLEKIAADNPQLTQLFKLQQVIARQVSHMKRLLEDLLDTSRVRTGKVTLLQNLVLLRDIIHNASEIAQPFFQSRQQALTIEMPPQPIVIRGDAVRLAQVFSNLLINASKYSRQSDPVKISARLLTDGTVAVCVKDQGVGIEPEIQPFIFDLFTQAPRTLDRSQGGLGIGLSMVRVLVQMHGGAVAVSSQGHGKGSEFIVVLPVSNEPLALEWPSPVHVQPSQPSRILIIEDNRDGNDTLNFCLKLEGHAVDSAYEGTKGLALAKAGHYDVIFCDIGLPGRDGYAVIKEVRQHCFEPVPCCVAMTGYDQQNYRDRAVDAGFDHFVVKPVAMDKLLSIVEAVANGRLLSNA